MDWIFRLLVLSSTVAFSGNSIAAGALDQVASGDLTHAIKEISAFVLLIFAISSISGLYMCITAIKEGISSVDDQGGRDPNKSVGRYVASFCFGLLCIVLPIFIYIGYNTLYGATTDTSMSSFSVNEVIAMAQNGSNQTGLRRYLPAATVFVFYGVLASIGLIAIYRGLKIGWIAITFGNDMYGTSLPFKTGTVLTHTIFGLGLIFLNKTQCLFVSTLGQSQLCW